MGVPFIPLFFMWYVLHMFGPHISVPLCALLLSVVFHRIPHTTRHHLSSQVSYIISFSSSLQNKIFTKKTFIQQAITKKTFEKIQMKKNIFEHKQLPVHKYMSPRINENKVCRKVTWFIFLCLGNQFYLSSRDPENHTHHPQTHICYRYSPSPSHFPVLLDTYIIYVIIFIYNTL